MALDNETEARMTAIRETLRTIHGVRGRDFAQAMARARRMLPREIRQAGAEVIRARHLEGHPRIAPQIDPLEVNAALTRIEAHLAGIDRAALRRDRLLAWLGRVAFNVLLLAGVVLGWLIWSDRQ